MEKKATIILTAFGLILFLIFSNNFNKKNNNFYEELIINFYNEEYRGIISEKYIDTNNHYSKTVILKLSHKTKIIFLDYESPMLFNYLRKGDSIIKEKERKHILLKRGNYDTIINLKFDNYIYHNLYNNNPDTIISKYLKKNFH